MPLSNRLACVIRVGAATFRMILCKAKVRLKHSGKIITKGIAEGTSRAASPMPARNISPDTCRDVITVWSNLILPHSIVGIALPHSA